MAHRFDVLPGGRIKAFRNRQPRCSCSKKTPGRPGLTRGICHGIGRRRARRERTALSQALRDLRATGFASHAVRDFHVPAPSRE